MSRRQQPRTRALLAGLLLAFVSLTVQAQSNGSVEERLERLERTLNSSALVNLANQMESVQRELQTLRGEVELLRRDLDEIKQRQRDLYQDIDRRLVRLENAQASAPAATGQPAQATGDTPTEGEGQATGATTQGDTGEADATSTDTGEGTDTASAQAPAQPAADPEAEQDRYEQAFTFLKAGRYQQAAEAFSQFLTDYPEGELSDNAKYWLGESYYVVRDFEQAMPAFQRVLDEHTNSPKKPDALLKIGFIQFEQGKFAESKATLQQVIAQYPGSGVAALAEQRLARIKAQGR